MNMKEKNNKTFCQKKSFRVFKGAIFGIFERPQTFFWQNVILFFFTFITNAFTTIS